MSGSKNMPQDRMMQAIGRIERALMRLETVELSARKNVSAPSDLQDRHNRLRQETQTVIGDLDRLLQLVKD
jgi:hypothetical protein